jgi:hypothetical protein
MAFCSSGYQEWARDGASTPRKVEQIQSRPAPPGIYFGHQQIRRRDRQPQSRPIAGNANHPPHAGARQQGGNAYRNDQKAGFDGEPESPTRDQ